MRRFAGETSIKAYLATRYVEEWLPSIDAGLCVTLSTVAAASESGEGQPAGRARG